VSLSAWGLEATKPGRLRLSSALALYRVRLRKRWVQELLAVLGIAAGVALLYATQIASTSLSGPVRSLNEGLVGHSQLQLLSRGSAGMPEETYDKVIALPGVRRAAPVLQVPGNLVGPRGQRGVTFFGADPRIVRLRGNLLKGFTSADAAQQQALVLPLPTARAVGVGVGEDVRLQLAGRSATVPAVVAGHEQIGSLTNTSIALMPLAYLQHLAGVGREVTRILVEAKPGQVASVRRGLQGLAAGSRVDVRPADYETRLFNEVTKPTSQSSTIFSILSALVGWLFAVCALLVTAAERRRLAIQQRDQGYPPSARLMTLLVDAAVIGIAGIALGLAAGELLSRQGFSSDVTFLSGAFPIGDQRVVTWQSVSIASAGGLLAAVFGVLTPVREIVVASLPLCRRTTGDKAQRHEPADHRPRVRGRLPIVGVACLAGTVAITATVPGAATVGLVLLALALVLLLPVILSRAIAGLEWCNQRERSLVAVELALQQLHARRSRTRALAIATTGAIAVFGATALQGARANLQSGLDDVARGLNSAAAVWVTPAGAGSSIGTASFAPSAAHTLARLPAVRSVGLYRAGLLDLTDRRAWIIGAPPGADRPIPPRQVLEGDMRLATARIRAGGWATVSRAIADDLGLQVGGRFPLAAPRPTVLRVAAITTNLGWSAGAVLINATDFARAWGSNEIAAYHVHLAPGTTPEEGRRQVTDALGRRSPFRVETAAQRADRQSAVARAGLSRLQQIAGMTLFAAVLAMSAAMTGLLWQHRPVIASLKLHGLRACLIWRSLVIETGILCGTGALVGGLFGLLGQQLCTRGVQVVTGYPVVQGLRLDIAASTVALVIGAALLVVIVPGYLVARVLPSWRD
jgi:putative ABC transport system permease protein